jgi:tetratricopeptide (TPR) repeat protein
MDAYELLKSHRYADSIREYRRQLELNPDDWAAIAGLIKPLMAVGAYAETLPLLYRLDEHERESLPGHPGSKRDLACSYWCLDQWPTAMKFMRGLVEGILDRSIEFGDLAGGVQQGLLLHYMGVTAKDKEAVAFSIGYLRRLSKKSSIHYWPGPLARYMLGEISFEEVLAALSKQSDVGNPFEAALTDVLARRWLCVALFHDGLRHRVAGQEELCMGRMQECLELENPFIEPEWYLARYEVERAAKGIHWRADAPAASARPMTGEEYARMPRGTHYVHPADGTLRRKK